MDPEASAGARLPFRPRLFHRATDVRLRDKFLAKEGAKSLLNLHFHRNSWGRFAPARASSLTVDRTLRSEPKGGLVEPTIAIRLVEAQESPPLGLGAAFLGSLCWSLVEVGKRR